MIIEHALLPVHPAEAAAFEAAFAGAGPIIESVPGFGSLSLSRCVEAPDTYVLLVDTPVLATDPLPAVTASPPNRQ